MKPLANRLFLAGLIVGLTACAQQIEEIRDSGARLEESHLRDAGFKLLLADTMDRQKMLRSLPSDTITRVQEGGAAYYIYPDPDGCVCLYVGRDAEYQRLQQLAADRQISNQQLMVNDMAANAQGGYGPYSGWSNWIINSNNAGRPNWDPH
jgi:hypothetical protein